MKAIIVIFALFASFASYSQGSWEKVTIPTTKNLNCLFFTDSLCGWVAGDSGAILHTTNGGLSWLVQETHTYNEVLSVFFLDRNRGWASSFNYKKEPYGTLLLNTRDGGATWDTSRYPVNDIFIYSILYFDTLRGWMGGRPHALVRTVDGGRNWTQADIDTSQLAFFPVEYITFYNEKHGYASGGIFDVAGVIWSTHDYGNHWKAIDASQAPADEVHALHCFDSTRVIGAGGDPDFGYGVGMIRTADGGANWAYQELGVQGNARDLAFRTGRECWAPLGARRLMIYSLDTGYTWTTQTAPDTSMIMRICFPDSLHGYGVGKDGTFIRFRPHAWGVEEHSPPQTGNSGIMLLGIRPNPCTAYAKVKVRISETARLKQDMVIRIFGTTGETLVTSAEFPSGPGEHETELYLGSLPPGVYFYRVFTAGKEGGTPLSPAGKIIRMDQ